VEAPGEIAHGVASGVAQIVAADGFPDHLTIIGESRDTVIVKPKASAVHLSDTAASY
jgi:hypothetical protein